jgi:spoIIIJ-associated protein
MTPSREFYAATVEEAVQKASTELGTPADELSYEVVDEGAAGFLGIGARDARIVVDTPLSAGEAEAPAEPEERAPAEEDIDDPVLAVPDVEPDSAQPVVEDPQEADLPEAPPELLEEVQRLVSGAVEAMGLQARVDVYDAGAFIAADVASDHTALFIGQKGETIDALQYLVNSAIYRDRPFVKRVILDAEGYRQRRVEALQGMAHRSARRALRERRTIDLPPMNPSERRVVHIFLKDNPKVTTASEGNGDNRRGRISPV